MTESGDGLAIILVKKIVEAAVRFFDLENE